MFNKSKLIFTLVLILTLAFSTAFSFAAGGKTTGRKVPAYSSSQVTKLDLTKPSGVTYKELANASRFDTLDGLYAEFKRAEKKYRVNAVFLMALSIVESGGGQNMYRENNMFGYGGKNYRSKAAGIQDVAKGLSQNYLSENGRYYKGKTIGAVNKYYCTSSIWTSKVATQMSYIYKNISKQVANK
ncbi:MAG: glucosaminidase domain-containing protein [Anaerovoracaceae bacterium]